MYRSQLIWRCELVLEIGRIITQDVQKNEARAEYGERLMRQLSGVLTQDYGQGYSVKNLWDMKRFFSCFEIVQPVLDYLQPAQLSSHRLDNHNSRSLARPRPAIGEKWNSPAIGCRIYRLP